MLLTRSRLCTGPKPGSSLHLHVLGTPPAFVLSQDQTLREELPQRVVRKFAGASSGRKLCRDRRRSESWACPWWDQALAPAVRRHEAETDTAPPTDKGGGLEPDVHRGLRSARRGQFWTAAQTAPREERSNDGVEPGHISRPGFGRRVCMLLSFQRPSHLLQEGDPPQGRARVLEPVPGRTDEYSAQNRRRRGGDASRVGGPPVRDGQDRTWTLIVRSRARSSKSISTICCQTPRASRPSTTGIVSDGPMRAARRWAWELESWLSRLCS